MTNAVEDFLDINDFAIRLSPHVEDGVWNGDVQLTVISTASNTLNDDDFSNIMSLATLMCVSIPLAEENETVRTALLQYMSDTAEEEEDKPQRSTEGNVIRVAFNQNKNQ